MKSVRASLLAGVGICLIAAAFGAQLSDAAPATTGLRITAAVTAHQKSDAKSLTSPAVSTQGPGSVLVALLVSSGSEPAQSFDGVSGGGLDWQIHVRSNGQPGTVEIWQAVASRPVNAVKVTAHRAGESSIGMITVLAFTGADPSGGQVGQQDSKRSTPSVSLKASRTGSMYFAAGIDYETASQRKPGSGQKLVDEYRSSWGETYWAQRTTGGVTSGQQVTLNTTSPRSHQFNFAAIEIRPRQVAAQPAGKPAPTTMATATAPAKPATTPKATTPKAAVPKAAVPTSGASPASGTSTWWRPGSATPIGFHWVLAGRLDLDDPVAMGLRDMSGKALPAPDVYDIDGETNSKETVAALHAQGKKVICYFDAGVYETFRTDAHKFQAITPRIWGSADEGWEGHFWLDIRRIGELEPIMKARMQMCKDKGFDAIEPDEIDGYGNESGFPLTYAHQLAYNRALAGWAHDIGMSIGQKGDVDQTTDLVDHFDWTLNEECYQYDECDALSSYVTRNKAVWIAEYKTAIAPGNQTCANAQQRHFNTYRFELDLSGKGGRQPCTSAKTW